MSDTAISASKQLRRRLPLPSLPSSPSPLLGSSTEIIVDNWQHHWKNNPPEEVFEHRTIFRQASLTDIVVNDWNVVSRAVMELVRRLNMKRHEAGFDWINLNRYRNIPYLLGVQHQRTVTAITALQEQRDPFAPYGLYQKILYELDVCDRREMSFSCSYRNFVGYGESERTVTMPGIADNCPLSWFISASVHGVRSLWCSVHLNGIRLVPAQRLRITREPGHLQRELRTAEKNLVRFLTGLKSQWLSVRTRDNLTQLTCKMLSRLNLPVHFSQSLWQSDRLTQCSNKLDWLCTVSQVFQHQPVRNVSNHLLKLSNSIHSETF
jgi:hypothetical protein